MKRLIAALVLALALALPASALAGSYLYANWTWYAGEGTSSPYSSSWWRNYFQKNVSADTTVTFIDNVSYGWHATVRASNPYLETHWYSSQVKKGYCLAHVGGFFGSCVVQS
jgi:hypothetical protein